MFPNNKRWKREGINLLNIAHDLFIPYPSTSGTSAAPDPLAQEFVERPESATVGSFPFDFQAYSSPVHALSEDEDSGSQGLRRGDSLIDFHDGDSNDAMNSIEQEEAIPLYPSAQHPSKISMQDFACLMLSFQRKNNVTDLAMDDLCKILKELLPTPNSCPQSYKALQTVVKRRMQQEFGELTSPTVKLCGNCGETYSGRGDHCESIRRQKKPLYYFNCSITQQIRNIVRDYGVDIIEFLRQQTVICEVGERVTDLTTGEFYQSILPNPNGSELILHLLVNTDGARFTKTKFGGFWPVHAVLAELPPKQRCKFENSILLALWQGEEKPDWHRLLKSKIEELRQLRSVGICVCISGHAYNICVRILATVCDLPASASIWQIVQFNGEYGCAVCLDKGVYINNRRLWPYNNDREAKDTVWWKWVLEEIESGVDTPIFGVKGRSCLFDAGVDPYLQNVPDIMHQSFEGVMDRILSEIFGSGKPWSLGRGAALRRIDAALGQIKFPLDFQRQLPSLENLSYYKATEFKNLLLYGLIPVIKEEFVQKAKASPKAGDFFHWIILYHEIICRLNCDSIVKETLPFVEKLVSVWQRLLPDFLGDNGQTYNAHATSHLVHFVRLFGPLHNFSTFAFESFMGEYVDFVTSGHGTIEQVARRVQHEKFARGWVRRAKHSCNPSLRAISGSVFRKYIGSCSLYIVEKVKLLAEPQKVSLSDAEYDVLKISFPEFSDTEVLSVSRAKVGSVTVSCESSEGLTKKCTYIGKFRDANEFSYAAISRIIIWNGIVYGLCKNYVVVGNIMDNLSVPFDPILRDLWENDEFRPYGNFFHLLQMTSSLCIFPLSDLCRRCIIVPTGNFVTLVEELMRYEHN